MLAVFQRLGGTKARDVAARFLEQGDAGALGEYARVCMPLYMRRKKPDPRANARSIANPAVLAHYFKPGGESHTADFRSALARVRCPTLVLAGDDDPITPLEAARELIAALPAGLARLEHFADTGHTVFDDEPRSLDVLREFALSGGL